jgi:hypothetical protein
VDDAGGSAQPERRRHLILVANVALWNRYHWFVFFAELVGEKIWRF